jgi:NAD(P)-dependent dehydrogenase (short-subunit alcohol dehydrogenase family)
MQKTVLITGSTDGIGLLAAKQLATKGQKVLLHGRSKDKLDKALAEVGGDAEAYQADLSSIAETNRLAQEVSTKHDKIDVLINNAGVLKAPVTEVEGGLDIRFVVNTLAPYQLTRKLLPNIPADGRIINLSSAAQARVDLNAMAGKVQLDDMQAYSQSKLAITIWSREMAKELPDGPVVIAVNPGSLLATKMVKQGFGIDGKDMNIGASLLVDMALEDTFADASGKYFDNDAGQFGQPDAAALDAAHSSSVMAGIKALLDGLA